MITFDSGAGHTTGFSTGGRNDIVAAADAALEPAVSLGPFTQTTDAFIGTDNYDYLVEGVPNFVANQDVDAYLPHYHASSDTLDKVDARELKANTAVAAVFSWELANSEQRPGSRQTRSEVAELIKATALDQKMRAFSLWDDFESGMRGREPKGCKCADRSIVGAGRRVLRLQSSLSSLSGGHRTDDHYAANDKA